jgi:hypothetical protein
MMKTELDLVREYMNSGSVAEEGLAVARSILDEAIASETWDDSQFWSGDQERATDPSGQSVFQRSHLRIWISVGIAVAVAACSIVVVRVLPTSKPTHSVTAAARISQLAGTVQPAPQPQPGQWSSYKMEASIAISIGSIGGMPTPNAEAAIPLAIQSWSNSTGTTCISQAFGTATFATQANAEAWHAIGLIDTPTNQPITDCAAGVEASQRAASTMEAIDVSTVTHDPATLAEQLQDGETGIPIIDQTAQESYATGFVRLVDLLLGPTTGAWPGFGQEILRTMALLPGIVSHGSMTTHSGQSGLAFSVRQHVVMNPSNGSVLSRWIGPTVILNPNTGALLEARDASLPIELVSAQDDFVSNPSSPVYLHGAAYNVSTSWVDPSAAPTIIEEGSLPAWVSTYHVIEAITEPTTTVDEAAVAFNPFLGNGNSAYTDEQVPNPKETTFDITILGTMDDVDKVASALESSGLFGSVVVKA